MAEGTGATAASGSAAGKMTMVVGVDESEHSYYALQWTLLHFFSPGQQQQYRLVVVTAKPTAASAVGLAGPGAADVLPFVEADLKRSSLRVIDKAKELCAHVDFCTILMVVVVQYGIILLYLNIAKIGVTSRLEGRWTRMIP
ncbi:hypothetical protein VPH35_096369 [Triticum aestivum]